MDKILETSVILSLIKHLGKWYRHIKQRAIDIYDYSHTYILIEIFPQKVKTYFKYSFFGKITDITIERNIAVLDESLVISWLVRIYRTGKDKIINYFNSSFIREIILELKNKLNFMPIRMSSIIIIMAIMLNLLLSILSRNQISFMGWLIRIMLLFISFAGLFNSVSLGEVTKTSFVLRKLYE